MKTTKQITVEGNDGITRTLTQKTQNIDENGYRYMVTWSKGSESIWAKGVTLEDCIGALEHKAGCRVLEEVTAMQAYARRLSDKSYRRILDLH